MRIDQDRSMAGKSIKAVSVTYTVSPSVSSWPLPDNYGLAQKIITKTKY